MTLTTDVRCLPKRRLAPVRTRSRTFSIGSDFGRGRVRCPKGTGRSAAAPSSTLRARVQTPRRRPTPRSPTRCPRAGGRVWYAEAERSAEADKLTVVARCFPTTKLAPRTADGDRRGDSAHRSIGGESPDFDESGQEVIEFYVDDEGAQFAGSLLEAFAALFLLFFAGALRSALRRGEGGTGGLSAVAFAGGIVQAVAC